jgi:hypothetical protein
MSRFTFRNKHEDETKALMAYFSTKLGVPLSQNDTINYVIEKTYERLKPFINAQKAQNNKDK